MHTVLFFKLFVIYCYFICIYILLIHLYINIFICSEWINNNNEQKQQQQQKKIKWFLELYYFNIHYKYIKWIKWKKKDYIYNDQTNDLDCHHRSHLNYYFKQILIEDEIDRYIVIYKDRERVVLLLYFLKRT